MSTSKDAQGQSLGNCGDHVPGHNGPDPNVPQRYASQPDQSIWVGASAGTGKTKVLTDRVLRLLLPREDGRPGSAPGRILCLTFTKAAASEMAHRVQDILGKWAVMDTSQLVQILEDDLLGYPPTIAQLQAAQQLFAQVIDEQNGLNIMTIHSFCQSILGRFPLEADLPPYFENIDEQQSADLLESSIKAVLSRAQEDAYTGSDLGLAVNRLVREIDEKSFTGLLQKIVGERYPLADIIRKAGSIDALYLKICAYYHIEPYQKNESFIRVACRLAQREEEDLRRCAKAFVMTGKKNAKEGGQGMLDWLDKDEQGRVDHFRTYALLYLTTDEGISLKRGFTVPSKDVKALQPDIEEVINQEAKRVYSVFDTIKRVESAQLTRDLLVFGLEVIANYSAAKKEMGVIDFDDSIMRTYALLKGESDGFTTLDEYSRSAAPSWVMFKLDQRIDHILVDEAQDTNPEQWRVIEAIVSEFFDGRGAYDDFMRTSFTVGDLKQSIYSFQRASPEDFQFMQSHFEKKIKQAGQIYKHISLDISFRSTASVLRVVDAVFSDPCLQRSVGGEDVRHVSHRKGQAGRVELWPLFRSEKTEARDFWTPPVTLYDQVSGSSKLAAYTARKIRNMLDRKEVLESRNRSIEPGDIMILVRSRSAFVDQMVRALKKERVPVSGSDRMVLDQQLAVQDLIAMARFCLYTEDELSLATILKSPFIGFTEEDLFAVAYQRRGSLWDELRFYEKSRLDKIEDGAHNVFVRHVDQELRSQTVAYLEGLINHVQDFGAYEFFSYILNAPCPADKQSGFRAIRKRLGDDALDAITEFLNVALDFRYDKLDKLQQFIDVQEGRSVEIKREMDERGKEVRIMTVHGSKGLQAPIVIMPDTIQSTGGKRTANLLWPHQTGLDFPLYAARKVDHPEAFTACQNQLKDLDSQEYYRLLYVAMTRAADRLYVAGYGGKNSPPESSWYFYIEKAMKAMHDLQVLSDEQGCEILRVENLQEAMPDKVDKISELTPDVQHVPSWLNTSAPEEPVPPRPLLPSRPAIEDMVPALSPLRSQDEGRFVRGNITHKLLQYLPDLSDDIRVQAATDFVQQHGKDFSASVQLNIVQEVLQILEHPDYAPFFQNGSLAEVPITGLTADHHVVSGQIDRLLVEEDKVWIIDYKTNRPPPRHVHDIPPIYIKQMRAYRDSIAQVYPGRKVICGLLWTDGPDLMILDL